MTVTTASYFSMYRNDSGAGHAFFQTSRSSFSAGSKSCPDERAFDIILNESKVDSVPPLTPSPFADPDRFSSPKKVLRKRSSRLSAASNSSYGSPKMAHRRRLARRTSSRAE